MTKPLHVNIYGNKKYFLLFSDLCKTVTSLPALFGCTKRYTSRKVFLSFLLCFIFILFNGKTYSQTWNGTVSTAWEDPLNWSTLAVPTTATDVTVPAAPSGGRFPTISTGTQGVKSLTIQAGATVTQTGGILQHARDWMNSGTYTATAGTLQFTGSSGAGATFAAGANNFYHVIVNSAIDPGFNNVTGSNVYIAGDFTLNNTAYADATTFCTFTFNGTGDQNIYSALASAATFGHLIINKPSGTAILTSFIKVNGNVTLTSGSLSTGSNYGLTVLGNASLNGGSLNMNASTISVTGSWTNAGCTVTGGACTVTISGNYTRSGGSWSAPTGSMILAGNFTNNGATGSFDVPLTLTGTAKTIGGTSSTAFSSITIGDDVTYTMNNSNSCSSLTFLVSANTSSFTVSTGTTLTVNGDITINQPSASKIISLNVNAGTVNVTGNVNIGGNNTSTGRIAKVVITTGTLQVAGNLVYNSASGVNVTAVVDMAGGAGTLRLAGSISLTNTSGTLTPGTTSMVEFYGTANQSITQSGAISYNTLKVNKTSGTVSQAANLSINGTLQMEQGTFSTSAGNYSLTVSGILLNGGSLSLNNSTVTINGSYTNNGTDISGGTCAVTVTGDFTRAGGSFSASSGTLSIGGNWINNLNSSQLSIGSITLTGAAKTIGGTFTTSFIALSVTGSITMNNSCSATSFTLPAISTASSLSVASGVTFTVNGDITINQPTAAVVAALNINAGTLTVNGNVSIGNTNTTAGRIAKIVVTTGTLDINGNITYNCATSTPANAVIDMAGGAGTLNLSGSITLTNTSGTLTPGSSSTFVFDGTGAQTMITTSVISYNNIIINSSSTVTLGGSKSVANVTLTQGTLALSTFTLTVSGNWINNGGVLSGGTGTIVCSGSSSQSLGGSSSTTFNNLTINNSSGITFSANETVNGTLTFTAGKITTGAYLLTCGSASTVSGAGAATGYVVGNLAIVLPVGATSKNFFIGTASAYAPIDLTFEGVTVSGTITASTTSTDHPNIASSNLNASITVNRYWTLSNTGLVFTSYSGVFTFVAGDLDAGITTDLLELRRYSGSWSTPTVGTRTSTSTQSTGLTAFGDFQIGQYHNPPTLTSISPTTALTGQTLDITFTGTGYASSFTTVNVGAGMTVNSTTVNSSTQVVANVTVAAGATAGVRNLSISVSTPGGGTSGTQPFTIGTSTSWKGTVSTAWNTAGNWTSGVPTSTIDAIIGDANFTGSFQPTVNAAAVCRDLTIGGTVASTLTVTTLNITASGNVLINSNGTVSHTSTGIIQLSGNWTNSGTYTAGTTSVPVVFAGTTLLGGSTTFGKFTINAGATVTQTSGTIRVKDPVITAGGTYLQQGGTLQVDHDWKNSGTFTATAGTIEFVASSGAGATFTASNQFYNVVINSGVDPGFENFASSVMSVAGDFTNNNTALVGSTNMTTTFNGSGNQTITSASTGAAFGHVVINKASGTLSLASNITVAGNWTNNGGTFSGGAYILKFTSAAGTISGTASTAFPVLTFPSAAVYTMNNNNSCAALVFEANAVSSSLTHIGAATLTVSGNVTINQPTASGNTTAWNINAGSASVGGNITIGNTNTTTSRIAKVVVTTGSLSIAGDLIYNSSASTAGTAMVDISGGASTLSLAGAVTLTNGTGTLSPGTTSTIVFNGSGAQTITTASAISYNHITINKAAGTATLAGAKSVADVTLTQGTLGLSSFTLTVTGNWLNNGGSLSGGTGTITFAGSASQSVGGSAATIFNNLTINNSSGITLGTNQTVNGTLTFTTGKITTGSYSLTCGSSATISGAAAGTGWVIGNFANVLSAGATNKSFPVGGTSAYTPIDLAFTGVTTGGTITASTTGSDHPNIGSSNLNASITVNRYWTLSNSGVIFTNYSGTFNFVAGDLDAGITTALLEVRRYSAGWSTPTIGTRTATSTQASGLTAFGDFQIGQYHNSPTLTSISPTTGLSGQTLDITFTGTGYSSGYSTVNVGTGMTVNSVTVNSSTELVANVTISAGASVGVRNLSVTVAAPGGGTTGTQPFSIGTSTSWRGTVSTAWNTAGNWTSGVPTSSLDAIIGDVNFTGSFQPTVNAAATCKTLTIGGSVASTLTVTTLNITVSGDITINANGTLSHTSTGIIQLSGNWTNSGTYTAGTISVPVVFAGTTLLGGSTTFGKFTVNAGAVVTQTAGIIRVYDPTINTGTPGGLFQLQGGTLRVDRDWKNSGTFTATGGTVEFVATSSAAANFSTGVNQFYNIVVNTGVDPGFDNFAASVMNVAGDFTNNNAALVNLTNMTATFNGTGSQTITSASTGAAFGHVVINKASGTLSLASNINIAGNWTNNGGTFSGGAYSVTFSGTATTIGGTNSTTFAALLVTGSVTLNINTTATTLTLANNSAANSLTISNGISLTVNGDVVVNQPATADFIHSLNVNGGVLNVSGNLTLSVTVNDGGRISQMVITTGTANITGDLIISNAFAPASAVIDMSGGAGILNLAGNFTMTSFGTLTPGTSSYFILNGTGNQAITDGSAISYNHLKIDKPSGTASISAALSISGTLIMTQGTFSTSASNYSITASGVTMTGGTFSIGNSVVTVNGDVLTSGGTMTVGTGSFSVSGNWTNNGGTIATVNVTFTGASKIIGGTSASSFGTLVFATGSTYSLDGSQTATALTFNASATASSLTQLNGSNFTVNGNVTINQPTASFTTSWNINAATATVNGNINIGGTNTTLARIASVVLTTGTLNLNGNLVYNSSSTTPQTAVVDMSGGASILNLSGSIVLTNTTGTLTPGTTSKVVFTGSAAQTLVTSSSISFNTIEVNKSANTVSLGAAATLTGDFILTAGTFSTAGYTFTFGGNWTNNGGTFSYSTTADLIIFNGASQSINGTNSTTFPTINIANGANVLMNNNNSCYKLEFSTGTGSASSFTHVGAATLTVNFEVMIRQIQNTVSSAWNINAGSATVNGNVKIGTGNDQNATGRVAKVVISTGTLTISGSMTFYANPSHPGNALLDMTAGGGTVNITGSVALQAGGWTGTISPGTNSLFNFNGSSAQTINFGSQLKFNNININNAAGVTAGAAFTATNVTGDLRVLTGSFSNGGFAITGASGKTFEVANGATFNSTGTAGMVTGFTTKTFGATSTVNFSGTTQTVSAETYGHLTLSGSLAKTMPASAFTIAGNFTTSGTITATAASAITVNGNVTLGSGTTFDGGSFTHNIKGNWTNNGATFTASTSTINLNGTAAQTMGGSAATLSMYNLTISNTSAAITVNTNTNISNTLNMNGTATILTPAATVVFNNAGAAGTITGTGTIQVTRLAATPDYSSQYKFTTNTFTNLTVDFAGAGDQTVSAFTYGGLKTSGSGTKTAVGAVVVNNSINITSGTILDMVTYVFSGSLTTTSGTGTLKTQNTSATPIPSGKTWTFGIFYNSSSAQTIVAGNYNDLNGTGGNRTLYSGTTGIAGTFTPGAGTYTTTGSTIDFNGPGAQSIPAFTFEGVTFSGGNTKTAAGNFSVTNTLTLGANTTLALGTNNITLTSTATGTARIAAVPTTAAVTYGTGRFIVQRYIPGRRKYRLITSSVTTSAGATLTGGQEGLSIWGNWQNNGNNVTANTGTIITGGSSGDGFDQNTTNASLYTYDAVNRLYVGFTSANSKNTKYTPLKAGVAYYMFVYGDRTNTVYTNTPSATTISATGTILTGDQTYNSVSTVPLSNVTDRYTMLGNPFASPIDWATVVKTNLYNTYWGWDPNLNSTGGYVTVSTAGGVTLISPFTGTTGLNQYIQPGQGFFVRTSAPSPVLTIREQDKVSNINLNAFRTIANSAPLIAVNMFYKQSGNSIFADGTLAAFDNNYSNKVTKEDAEKMKNGDETVAFQNGNISLSIEARKFPAENDTLYLNITKINRPEYTLQIFAQQLDTAIHAYLIDKYLNTSSYLSLTDTNRITFNVTSEPASYRADRFSIVFKKSTSTPVIEKRSEIKVFPNPVKQQFFNLQLNEIAKGIHYIRLVNSIGQVALKQSINHDGTSAIKTILIHEKIVPGIYQLQVSNSTESYHKTIVIE